MGKISLKASLISEEENLNIEITGIKTKNKIVYKENNITVTILIFNNKIEMNRTCNEYKINMIFEKDKKTISNYQVFGMPKTFDLETQTKKLIINDNDIDINYNLEGNNFKYSLIWEVSHENNIKTRN
jgi:Cft2 family RNA processing exonuclease